MILSTTSDNNSTINTAVETNQQQKEEEEANLFELFNLSPNVYTFSPSEMDDAFRYIFGDDLSVVTESTNSSAEEEQLSTENVDISKSTSLNDKKEMNESMVSEEVDQQSLIRESGMGIGVSKPPPLTSRENIPQFQYLIPNQGIDIHPLQHVNECMTQVNQESNAKKRKNNTSVGDNAKKLKCTLPYLELSSLELKESAPSNSDDIMYDFTTNHPKIREKLYIKVSSPCELVLDTYWSMNITENPKELGKFTLSFEKVGTYNATTLKSHLVSEMPKLESESTKKNAHVLFHLKIGSHVFHIHSKGKMKKKGNTSLPSVIVLDVNNQSATLELAPQSKTGKRGNFQSGNYPSIKFKSAQ